MRVVGRRCPAEPPVVERCPAFTRVMEH
jgi:hypothetical protein